jgi:phage terminase small subunit
MALKKLRNKQIVFVEAYLRTWNATQAAKDAGYSKKTAYSIGQNNLKKPDIAAAVQKRLAEMKMSADEVLLLLSDQARVSIKPFVKITDEGFIYFDFSQPGAMEKMHLIKKIRSKRSRRIEGRGDDTKAWEDEIVEVELVDSQNALDKLGRHHKLFTDDTPPIDLHFTIEGLKEALHKAYGEDKDGSNADS